MYAKQITESMQQTIDETNRRRAVQMEYNREHHLTPQPIVKAIGNGALGNLARKNEGQSTTPTSAKKYETIDGTARFVAEDAPEYGKRKPLSIEERIEWLRNRMKEAAAALDFVLAAQLRDEMLDLMGEADRLKDTKR